MKSFVFVTLLFGIFSLSTADIWKPCGTSKDHLSIQSVKIIPDPPQIGKNLTIIATGTLDETISSGIVRIELAYDGITLLNNTFDLCTLLKQYVSCPLKNGPITLTVTQTIPSDVIPGPYTGQVNIYDQNSSEVTCIALTFNLSTKKSTKSVPVRSTLMKSL